MESGEVGAGALAICPIAQNRAPKTDFAFCKPFRILRRTDRYAEVNSINQLRFEF
jgi:hypothetical protein